MQIVRKGARAALAVLALALGAAAQEGAPDGAPDMEAMMRLGRAGPHHERLHKMAGTWDVAGRFWMAPDQPPEESTGVSVVKPILEGRFMHHEYTSSFMGMPFLGFGLDGYDNVKQKYVSYWTDTMSTAFYPMEGTLDEKTGVLTMHGDWTNPMGGAMKVKSESVHNADGSVTFSMFDEVDGKWHKTMELVYRRRADGPTKESALALLREVLAALEAKDYAKAAGYFAFPKDVPQAIVEKELARFIERKNISARGIEVLGEKAKWGRLADAMGAEEAARVCKSYKCDPATCWGFSLDRAAAAFTWDGKTLKVVIFDDIGTLE